MRVGFIGVGTIGKAKAPVRGGRKGAEDKDLCYMVGGAKEVLEKCRELFSTSGSHIFHMGIAPKNS